MSAPNMGLQARPISIQFGPAGEALTGRDVLGSGQPQIGLLTSAEESCKGNDLTVKAYPLLEAESRLRFAGNWRGRRRALPPVSMW